VRRVGLSRNFNQGDYHSYQIPEKEKDQDVYMTFSNLNTSGSKSRDFSVRKRGSPGRVTAMQIGSNHSPEKKTSIRRVYESLSGAASEFKLDHASNSNEILEQFKAQLKE
jgi:hypothetical protein